MPAAPSVATRRLRFPSRPADDSVITVALIGRPNAGKSTLFNALTGLRQKVSNYPGVTVECRVGELRHGDHSLRLIDLPGSYSLSPDSPDEELVQELLLNSSHNTRFRHKPDKLLLVVDMSNPERCLFLATQVAELGLPAVIALTMCDEATQQGRRLDPQRLSLELGLPVYAVHAASGRGLEELLNCLCAEQVTEPRVIWQPESELASSAQALVGQHPTLIQLSSSHCQRLALSMLYQPRGTLARRYGLSEVAQEHQGRLDLAWPAWRQSETQWRYAKVRDILSVVEIIDTKKGVQIAARLDAWLTHPVWGLLVFAVVMALMFQSIFSWAGPLMDAVETLFAWIGSSVAAAMPEGPLCGLLVDGIISGTGGVLVFLPQILLMFFFLALMEDSGYMSRAAFVLHRHMRRCGLQGRSFIPLMSGFACAIPAIMATRSIPSLRDRLLTMMAIPFMSCSARLPVYALMIACFVPAKPVVAGLTLQGVTLLAAYSVSIAAGLLTALVLRKTVLKGPDSPLILELPPYRWPSLRNVLLSLFERGKVFVTQAGTVILALSILLWFLASYPLQPEVIARYNKLRTQAQSSISAEAELSARMSELDAAEAAEQLQGSFAGQLGRSIEPLIAPLGFDWKIGIGLIASFAAREVLVSTLAVVYGVGDAGTDTSTLHEHLRNEINPRTGKPVFNVIVALNLMLFFILACQCIGTVGVVRRETNSWKWTTFMVLYMTLLAYVSCMVFYQTAIRIWPGAV